MLDSENKTRTNQPNEIQNTPTAAIALIIAVALVATTLVAIAATHLEPDPVPDPEPDQPASNPVQPSNLHIGPLPPSNQIQGILPIPERTPPHAILDPFLSLTINSHTTNHPPAINNPNPTRIMTIKKTPPADPDLPGSEPTCHNGSHRPAIMAGGAFCNTTGDTALSENRTLPFSEISIKEFQNNSPKTHLTGKEVHRDKKQNSADKKLRAPAIVRVPALRAPDCAIVFYFAPFYCSPCEVVKSRMTKLLTRTARSARTDRTNRTKYKHRVYFTTTTTNAPRTLQEFAFDTAHLLSGEEIPPNSDQFPDREPNSPFVKRTKRYKYRGPVIKPTSYPVIVVYHRTITAAGNIRYRRIKKFVGASQDNFTQIERILEEMCPKN